MIITSLRRYLATATISKVFIDGKFFGHQLEDIGRPDGVKIPRETCIPEGCYQVAITHSNKFRRLMPVLFNKPDHSIERRGVRFTGIRAHGGNTTAHTAGCPLVGERTNGIDKVWSSLEAALTERIDQALAAGDEVRWIITEDI